MRILSVVHAYPPFSRAGAENCVEALSREQRRRGHDARVFHRIADPALPEYDVSEGSVEGVPVTRINRCFSDLACFEDTYRSETVAKAFARSLDDWTPDVIHFHHVTGLSTTCVHEAAHREIPVVFTLHDFWLLCSRGQLLRRDLTRCDRHTQADCVRCMAHQLRLREGHAAARRLWKRATALARLRLPREIYRWLASRPFADETQAVAEIAERERHVREMCGLVDAFVSPSRFLRDRFAEFGIDAERVHVLENGFDFSRWPPVPSERDAGGPLRVAYLGSWIPSKGVHLLLEAFREIDPREAVLEIHGAAVPYDGWDGYDRHLLTQAEGLPHVQLGGRYEPEEVPTLLARAQCLVVPSIWFENSPLTVHEAFLSGVPVIASDHGGLRELIVHERNGLLFRPGDVAELRGAILRLARDRAFLARLSACKTEVTGIAKHADDLLDLYRRSLRRRGVGR